MAFLTVDRVPPRQLGYIPSSNGLGRTLHPSLSFQDTLPGSDVMAAALTQRLREQALSAEAARVDQGEVPDTSGGSTGGPSRAEELWAWVQANKLLVGVGAAVLVGGAYLLLRK